MTIAILATAWTITLASCPWNGPARGPAPRSAVIGVLLGLCIQTLVTAVFAAAVVAALALARVRREHHERVAPGRRRPRRVRGADRAGAVRLVRRDAAGSPSSGAGGGRTAATRAPRSAAASSGSSAWRGTRRTRTTGRGRCWPWSSWAPRRWPPSAGRSWAHVAQRAIRLAIGASIVAAWIELALAQRYSSHYFSVLVLPTWLAAATATADALALAPPADTPPTGAAGCAPRARRRRRAVHEHPGRGLRDGVAAASGFRGVDDLAAARRANESGNVRTVRATLRPRQRGGRPAPGLDRASVDVPPVGPHRGDPGTSGGASCSARSTSVSPGPQFVPPHTAEWFADDLERTDPQVFVEEVEHPVPADSAPWARAVAADFVPVYRRAVQTTRLTCVGRRRPRPREPAAGRRGVGAGDRGGTGLGGRWRRGDREDHGGRPGACSTDRASAPRRGARRATRVPRRASSSTTPAARRGTGERQYLSTAGGEAWSSTDSVELERSTWAAPAGAGAVLDRRRPRLGGPRRRRARSGRPCGPGVTPALAVAAAGGRSVSWTTAPGWALGATWSLADPGPIRRSRAVRRCYPRRRP